MNRFCSSVCFLALVFALVATDTQAQGMFGQRNLGGTITPGQRTLTGRPGDQIAQQQQDAGQVTGGERFLRQNRQPGQFVGSDTGEVTNFFSQAGGQNALPRGLENLIPANSNRNAANRRPNSQTQRSPLRTTLRVGFRYRKPQPVEISTVLGRRLQDSVGRVGAIEVAVEGRMAILRGEVLTPEDRVLAERLAALEPGISAVQNDLTVLPLPTPPTLDLPSSDENRSPGSAR